MTIQNQSPQDVLKNFRRRGTSIADWAAVHGFNPALVYQILAGRRKCLRGQSHRIAVELGIKESPQEKERKEKEEITEM